MDGHTVKTITSRERSFFFGFGLPEVAGFSVPAFLPFAAIVSPF
jgi:hypothetical protein